MEVQIISNTVQKFNGESFYLCGSYFQHKGKRLHRTVWEYHHGEIPKGYHIHHKDGNSCNNDINNLTLMQGSIHLSEHMQPEDRKASARANIKRAVEAAPAWHHSEEGKRWHSEHSKESWDHREYLKYTCSYCGKELYTKNIYAEDSNHFCGNTCKAAYRRLSGVDNEERICPICGITFVVSRYSKNITCSGVCARKRRWGK